MSRTLFAASLTVWMSVVLSIDLPTAAGTVATIWLVAGYLSRRIQRADSVSARNPERSSS